jgi:tellurite resistance protein
VAHLDGIVVEEEVVLLERLAGLLELTPVQIKAAAAYAKEGTR